MLFHFHSIRLKFLIINLWNLSNIWLHFEFESGFLRLGIDQKLMFIDRMKRYDRPEHANWCTVPCQYQYLSKWIKYIQMVSTFFFLFKMQFMIMQKEFLNMLGDWIWLPLHHKARKGNSLFAISYTTLFKKQ